MTNNSNTNNQQQQQKKQMAEPAERLEPAPNLSELDNFKNQQDTDILQIDICMRVCVCECVRIHNWKCILTAKQGFGFWVFVAYFTAALSRSKLHMRLCLALALSLSLYLSRYCTQLEDFCHCVYKYFCHTCCLPRTPSRSISLCLFDIVC